MGYVAEEHIKALFIDIWETAGGARGWRLEAGGCALYCLME